MQVDTQQYPPRHASDWQSEGAEQAVPGFPGPPLEVVPLEPVLPDA